ncbi:MAG: hypothetical protein WC705_02635 [Candidatus Paceibacterota bacterium]|jgi:hypothetical protein
MIFRINFVLISVFCLLVGFLFINVALAEEPEVIFSWKANSYAPEWFGGKIFPINQSKITTSFEAVSQNNSDFGKILNLSSKNIKWFVNNSLYKEGKGLKSVVITKDDFPRDNIEVKINFEIFDENKNYNLFVNRYFSIPIVSPEIVISHKKTDLLVSLNEKINFKAFPFFFSGSLKNLTAKWTVNSIQVERDFENLFDLVLNIASESPTKQVTVEGFINNLNNQRESASKSILFKF